MTALAHRTGADAATFTLQLSSATPASELREWFAGAEQGARAVYAAGVTLPREAEGVKLARRLEESGAATLTQERDQADPRRWRFMIIKMSPSPSAATLAADERVASAGPAGVPRAVDRTDLRKLLSELRSCAERGRPCPSLTATARLLGLPRGESGRQKANYLFRRLKEEGSIAIESQGRGAPRIVTILAEGRARGKRTSA